MVNRARLHVRWPVRHHELVASAADQLGMSVSELVRRAAVAAALEALRTGAEPPATAPAGEADGRSKRSPAGEGRAATSGAS